MTTFTASEVVAKLRERFASGNDVPVPDVRLTRAEFDVIADRLEADDKAVPVAYAEFTDGGCIRMWSRQYEERLPGTRMIPLYTHPSDTERLAEALRFYADGNHLFLGDPGAWDTVSGEPQNWLCDEAGTATIEDGTVAKQALATHSAQAQPPAASVTDAMVERALSAYYVRDIDSAGFAWEDAVGDPRIAESDMRAALEAALAAQENPNG